MQHGKKVILFLLTAVCLFSAPGARGQEGYTSPLHMTTRGTELGHYPQLWGSATKLQIWSGSFVANNGRWYHDADSAMTEVFLDADGNILSMVMVNLEVDTVAYRYDSLGRLAGEGNWGRAVARYRTKVSDAPEVAGLAFFGEWGSLRYAMNAAFSSALYASVYGDSAAAAFAERQWDWALGDNPYGHSFVVGVGTNPPKAPHHKNAFGERRWASPSDTSRYPLVGALVGGPHLQTYSDPWMTSPPGWRDAMNDYVGNEVSIDYNAALVGATAFVVDEESEASAASGN